MKAVISITNMVVDTDNLRHLELLLQGGVEKQGYDYKSGGNSVYYIRPADQSLTINLLTDELYEAQKLVWKLKSEQGNE